MRFEAIPIIRLEVEGLKHAICHQMGIMGSELSAQISKRIDEAVASYNYEAAVREVTHNAIQEAIRHYFQYGQGKEAITEAVNKTLSEFLGLVDDKGGKP